MEKVTNEMINFWIEKNGELNLDTPDEEIVDFFKSGGKHKEQESLTKGEIEEAISHLEEMQQEIGRNREETRERERDNAYRHYATNAAKSSSPYTAKSDPSDPLWSTTSKKVKFNWSNKPKGI